jgi:hypothetical protein
VRSLVFRFPKLLLYDHSADLSILIILPSEKVPSWKVFWGYEVDQVFRNTTIDTKIAGAQHARVRACARVHMRTHTQVYFLLCPRAGLL